MKWIHVVWQQNFTISTINTNDKHFFIFLPISHCRPNLYKIDSLKNKFAYMQVLASPPSFYFWGITFWFDSISAIELFHKPILDTFLSKWKNFSMAISDLTWKISSLGVEGPNIILHVECCVKKKIKKIIKSISGLMGVGINNLS